MLAVSLSIHLTTLILVGVLIRRSGLVDDQFDKSLSAVLLNVTLPCTIIRALQIPFSAQQLLQCGILLLLSAGICLLSFGVGQLLFLACGKTDSARILRFGAMFSNFTFVGLPVVELLYGQQGLFYFVVFSVPVRLFYYSSAKPLLSPPGLPTQRHTPLERLKGYFSPPVVAALVGLTLYITQLPLPTLVSDILASLGGVSSPMGMVLCGITLGKHQLRTLFQPKNFITPLARGVLMPAIVLVVVWLLPVDPLIAKIAVIFTALPVASLLSAFTVQYHPNPQVHFEAAGSVFLSTLLFTVTLPIWAAVLNAVFP